MNIDGLVDRIAAAVVERLKPAPPPPKPPRPMPAPPRVETETERVQAHFAFLREHPECGFRPRRWW